MYGIYGICDIYNVWHLYTILCMQALKTYSHQNYYDNLFLCNVCLPQPESQEISFLSKINIVFI